MATHFPAGQGAKHGPWEDPTFTPSTAEIHAPRYFKEFEEFGAELAAANSDELMLKDVLTKEVYDKFKDKKTKLGVTLDKCIKGGIDRSKLGASWNTGKVGLLLGDAECIETFRKPFFYLWAPRASMEMSRGRPKESLGRPGDPKGAQDEFHRNRSEKRRSQK